MITEHDDSMYAQSRLGKEASFIVKVPVFTEPEQLKLDKVAADDSRKVAGAKLLVVDDEPTVLQLLNQVLTDEGHQVETVANASDALARIESNRYSLIILDIKMPGMSGIELYQRLPNIARSLVRRVVFITGDVIGARTTAFLSKTKAPYIFKPFSTAELKKAVNSILAEGT